MKISLYPPLSIHELGHRDNQEDALWPLDPTADNQLFVLCDGMGGHEHGEVASQTVSQAFGEWYQTNATHPIKKQQLEDALAYAYAQLDQKDGGEFKKMGTTLTLLYVGSAGVIAMHMGDSRIYHIRPDVGILYQSRDHSLVFDLYQSGEITYEEMLNFTQKNVITRAMTPGEDNRHRPDMIQIIDVQPGDYFYMCSDGMLEQMSNNELVALLSSDVSDEEKRQQLIDATANNQDNHSAWLIHINDVVTEKGDEQLVNEEPTSRCNALNIVPQTSPEEDVKVIDDDDDVVVVSTPKPSIRKLPFLKVAISVILLLLALIIAWFLFLRDTDKKTPKQPEPMMQSPIKHDHKSNEKDTIVKDTNIIKNNESGNQQPVNAPRGNHPTRHI